MKLLRLLLLSTSLVLVECSPVCVTGYTLVGNKCLKLVTTTASHDSAEAICASNGATLATARNAIDNRALGSFVGTSLSHIWLGIYCNGNDPTSCFWDDASGPAETYSNFARSFPYVDIGNCVYYLVTGSLAGQWMSASCNDLHPFVCELPTTVADSCAFNYNGFCYYPSRTTSYGLLDFSDAQHACEKSGSNLASVHSQNEMRFIKSIHTGGNTADDILIGGIQYSANAFVWTDSSPWNYDNFPRTFSKGCVHLSLNTNSSGAWSVQDCETPARFLCKRPAGAATVAPPTPFPSNIPSCNTAILNSPGRFTSLNYPSAYTNNLHCTYSLSTTGNNQILLTFLNFYTELNRDIVSVYDGTSAQSPLIGRFSGPLGAPFSVKSTSNRMFIIFQTDSYNVYSGFSAKFITLI